MYPDFDLASLGSDAEDPTGGGAAMDFPEWPTKQDLPSCSSASVTKRGEADPFEIMSGHEETTTDDDVHAEVLI